MYHTSFLFIVALVAVTSGLTITKQTHITADNIAKVRDGTVTSSGIAGPSVQPRRMSSASCLGRFFVAWTAQIGQNTVGRLSQFSARTLQHIGTVNLGYCNEMGGLHVTDDCSIITAMCRAPHWSRPQIPNFVNAIANQPPGSFGWKTNGTEIDDMYLLEFTSLPLGPQSRASRVVLISSAIGGWNYGQYEAALDSAKTNYFITLKITVGKPGNYHEGSMNLMLSRQNWAVTRSDYACGSGHVLLNRAMYNEEAQTYSLLCWLDASEKVSPGNSVKYWTSRASNFIGSAEILTLPWTIKSATNPAGRWRNWGGTQNLVSLGQNGYFGVATGPLDGTVNTVNTIGVIKLPLNSDNFSPSVHKWKWFRNAVTARSKDDFEIAFPNLQVMGARKDRFLIGWATSNFQPGVPRSDFKVVEVNEDGCMLGPIQTLTETGWGADNVWTYLPETGCILMTYAFENTPLERYNTSKKLRLTTVCPGAKPTVSSCGFSRAFSDSDSDEAIYENNDEFIDNAAADAMTDANGQPSNSANGIPLSTLIPAVIGGVVVVAVVIVVAVLLRKKSTVETV